MFGSCRVSAFRVAHVRWLSNDVAPILDPQRLIMSLQACAPSMASSLRSQGYWTNFQSEINDAILPRTVIEAMREQSIRMQRNQRFEPSWSERWDDATGTMVRLEKKGVWACEPDGSDYEMAPDILSYMATMISTLPSLLNEFINSMDQGKGKCLNLSDQMFNAKLAVTSSGGSKYPLHIDNTIGITGSPKDDTRKLTCILYLNPNYQEGDGGHLRLLLLHGKCLDLDPRGGRLVIFWSDEIPHEVLPCKPDSTDAAFDRYALTIWLPDNDPRNIHSIGSKFQDLRQSAFDTDHVC